MAERSLGLARFLVLSVLLAAGCSAGGGDSGSTDEGTGGSALTQSRADRRRRTGGARRHLELDIARNLLSHVSLTLYVGRRASPRLGPVQV
jgi:hypothetical protein